MLGDDLLPNRLLRILLLNALLALIAAAPAVRAQGVVFPTAYGIVDWSNGILESAANGQTPGNCTDSERAVNLARGAAVKEARAGLLELIKKLRIDAQRRIEDLIREKELSLADLGSLVRQNSRILEITHGAHGSVRARMVMSLRGSFAERVLPDSVQQIHQIRQPDPPKQEKKDFHTGIVLDARGVAGAAALVPRILDEEDNEIYGPAYISRDYAVQKGAAGFASQLNDAKADPRVASNPLTVKAIRTAESGPSDIVISNADAKRIRGVARNLLLLHKCRVMIVLD
jgi:hypothetical protein